MNREQRRLNARLGRQHKAKKARATKLGGLAAIGNSLPYAPEEAAKISNEARMAWWKMCNGDGSTRSFDELVYALNTLRVLVEPFDDGVEVVTRAQEALLRIRQRYLEHGKFGVDAEALRDVPPALDLYDEFLSYATPRMMVNAMTAAVKRMERARVELIKEVA